MPKTATPSARSPERGEAGGEICASHDTVAPRGIVRGAALRIAVGASLATVGLSLAVVVLAVGFGDAVSGRSPSLTQGEFWALLAIAVCIGATGVIFVLRGWRHVHVT
jgi:hypothetical protein